MNDDAAREAFVRMLERDEEEGRVDPAPPGSDYLNPCSIYARGFRHSNSYRRASRRYLADWNKRRLAKG